MEKTLSSDQKKQSRLLDLAERYDEKAGRAYMRYQETGIQRHHREYENSEELADALRIAANAEHDHRSLVCLRGDIANLATAARNGDPEQVAKNVIALAEMHGLIRKEQQWESR